MKNRFFFLLLFLSSGLLFAQKKVSIAGKIVDEKNKPVRGANVILKGTALGTVSNGIGEYQLEFEYNLTLSQVVIVVSFVGYNLKEETMILDHPGIYRLDVTMVRPKKRKMKMLRKAHP